MIGLVRNEWKKVFLPVLLTTVLLAIAMGVLSCTIYQNYVLHYDLEAWEVGTELFSLLYPLFVVVPLCWNLYYERKNNFLLYIEQLCDQVYSLEDCQLLPITEEIAARYREMD